MTKRNALILSKNENISRIACAELLLLGYTPKILAETPFGSEAELILFDATSIELSAPMRRFLSLCETSKKIAITTHPDEKLSARFDKIFTFPFSLTDFRQTVLENSRGNNADNSTPVSNNEKCFIRDTEKAGVFFGGVFVPLSDHEIKLLSLLCENSGRCVSKKEILTLFEASDSNIAEVYICHLRNKLETPFGIKVIYTVRGEGYMTDHVIR